MARQASVRIKNGRWYSEAGGVGRYFGRVDAMSRTEAMALLWGTLAGENHEREEGRGPRHSIERTPTHASEVNESRAPTRQPIRGIIADAASTTVSTLADAFLDWVKVHRGEKALKERSRHLGRFRDAFGDLQAHAIDGTHIEAFTASLRAAGHAPDYVHKHLVSVGAMFNKGVRKGWLPPGIKPLAGVEPIRLPPKALTEDVLPSRGEIRALFASADADPYGQMGDIVRLYHATGARTHELINARVGEYQPNARTIVLAHHKRSHTMREPKPRTITLNAEARDIVAKRCGGREPSAPIFPRPSDGKPYSSVNIAERFQNVRKRAGIRESITLYSFRHLWISEALMAGLDALIVARMAGTSVKMLETVYGHFRTQSLADAQTRLDAMRGQS